MADNHGKVIDTRDKSLKASDSLLAEAQTRFNDVVTSEQYNREQGLDDLRMLGGFDHWDATTVTERETDGRPVLTINKLPSFASQVSGNIALNKISIKVVPYGEGATKQLAETLNGLIRNIENVSNAEVAYQTAADSAINNGFGYFRVVKGFIDEDTFEQELRIQRIRNPFTVYMDPLSEELDGRDSRFAFVTEMVPRAEYNKRFPGKTITPYSSNNDVDALWFEEDLVRVAEYWVRRPETRTLILLSDGRTIDKVHWEDMQDELTAAQKTIHAIPNPEGGNPQIVEGPAPEGSGYPEQIVNPIPTIQREREIPSSFVEHYLLDGSQILEGPTRWDGKFIPIIPVMGKELIIEGKRFLYSAFRHAKDPQRIYNYMRTAAVETTALAPKAPYMMEEGQIGNYKTTWKSANRKNLPYLPYKYVKGVPPPARQIVTQTAVGEITEANLSNDEMKATTGIFDASLGAKGNETSGRAILARDRKSDISNITFPDNLRRGVQFCGDILLDLIPKTYDTARQIVVLNKKDEEEFVPINQTVFDASGKKVIVNDMTLGKYKIVSSTGPSTTTQRVEAAEGMLDFVRTAPETASYIIDLIAESQDWPGAQKIAERLRKTLPAGILSEEEGGAPPPPPDPMQLIESLTKALKMQGEQLNNQKKEADIEEANRQKTEATAEEVNAEMQGAVVGLLEQLGILPQEGGANGGQGGPQQS